MRSDYQSSCPRLKAPANTIAAPQRVFASVLNPTGCSDVLGTIPVLSNQVPTQYNFLPSDVGMSSFAAFQWIDPDLHQRHFKNLDDLSDTLTGALKNQIPQSIVETKFKHLRVDLSVHAIDSDVQLNVSFDPTHYPLPELHKSKLPKPILNYVMHTLEHLPFVHYMAITPPIISDIACNTLFMGMDSDEDYISETSYTMDEEEAEEWLESKPLFPSHIQKKFKPYQPPKRVSKSSALRAATTEKHRSLIQWATNAANLKLTDKQTQDFNDLLQESNELRECDAPYEYPPLFLDMTDEPEYIQVIDELHNEIMQGDCAAYFELELRASSKPALDHALALIETLNRTLREIDFLIELNQ